MGHALNPRIEVRQQQQQCTLCTASRNDEKQGRRGEQNEQVAVAVAVAGME